MAEVCSILTLRSFKLSKVLVGQGTLLAEDHPMVVGLYLPTNRNAQFMILASGALFCAIGFAALQEGVFRVPGFKFTGWMTLITSLAYAGCGFVEMAAMNGGKIERRGSLWNYVFLSTLTFSGMYLTNYALKFLNYATRIVFKSAKVIPVMIFSTVIQGKRYSALEYFSAAVLVAGVALFTLGDVSSMPSFNPLGVVLIAIALSVDAVTSNFEEKNFFRIENPCSQAEVLAFASLFGSVWSVASCFISGELSNAIAHSAQYPHTTPMIALFSVMGYLSVTFVLSLIKYFGATETEIVKSLRKVLSIIISFVLYPKPLNWKYGAGFVMVLGSIYLTFELKRQKAAKKESENKTEIPGVEGGDTPAEGGSSSTPGQPQPSQ
jgi:adenosine 3'-phospho 5'-phosphosulfate transporter B3